MPRRQDILLNAKVKLIRTVISIVLFLDYLGDVPHKFFRAAIRIVLYFSILYVCLGVALNTNYQKNIYAVFNQYFHPMLGYTGIPSDILVAQQVPRKIYGMPFPTISATAVFAVDLKSEYVLYSANASRPLPPASTTKLMTAIIARSLYNLDDFLSVPEICTQVESQKSGYLQGEKIRVRDLLYTLLVNSSGDSACVLAYGEGSYSEFVKLMNAKASELNLKNTHYTNPVGLDELSNYTSAYDLFLLAKHAIADPVIADAVATREYSTLSGVNSRTTLNTNKLLWELPGTIGIKTGRTEGAGEVLIHRYRTAQQDLIIVVMGSSDRFSDTINILTWIQQSYAF